MVRRVKFENNENVCYFEEGASPSQVIPRRSPHLLDSPPRTKVLSNDTASENSTACTRAGLQAAKLAFQAARQARAALNQHPDQTQTLLRFLKEEDADRMNGSLRAHKVSRGQAIYHDGSSGAPLYFIASGECLTRAGQVLHAGCFFGERAFLDALEEANFRRGGKQAVIRDPLFGSIASFLQALGTQVGGKSMDCADAYACSEEAIVLELKFDVAAEILRHNDKALDFLRSTSSSRAGGPFGPITIVF
jgi:CRP-like cAMP-binding protein